jgi:ACS family tartrate transporter-like MFS transporter
MPSTAQAVAAEVYPSALVSALKKARWRLIPLLSICYLVAYIDRANVSFAAETMNHDLGFSPKVYGLGAGIFFLSYALCEIPSNRMLLRFGPRRWLARIMVTWGLLAAAMVFIRGPYSWYGMRLLLGFAEAGYFPGAIFYLSQWFPAAQRARTISLFYIAFPLSNVVMGAAAGSLLGLNGKLGLAGWQWLFLIEGLPAILLSAVIFTQLPDTPKTAKWLSGDEREALEAELASDPVRVRDALAAAEAHVSEARRGAPRVVAESGLWTALKSGKSWAIALYFFCTLGSNYALSFSLPLILKDLTGGNAGQVGYVVAGVGLAGAVAMLLNAMHSDRTGERCWHIVAPALVMGAALLVAGLHLHGWGAVAALAVGTAGFFAMQGPLLGLPTMIFSGEAAAVSIAMLTMGGVFGGFVGPYWTGWIRETTGGYGLAIGALCIPCWLGAAMMLMLMRRMNQTSSV